MMQIEHNLLLFCMAICTICSSSRHKILVFQVTLRSPWEISTVNVKRLEWLDSTRSTMLDAAQLLIHKNRFVIWSLLFVFCFVLFLWLSCYRLREHLRLNKRETLRQLQHNIAPCRPLFNLFDANRHLFCRHIIDPMNGLWFSGFLSLSVWAVLTPIVLGLASIYKKMDHSRGIIRSSSHQ